MNWLKTKFYPVDFERRVIFNDPQPRERDCSYGKYDVMKDGTIGIKGTRLIQHGKRYEQFEVKPPKDAKPYQPDIYIGDDAGQVARTKSRYGHRSWIVWKARDGKKCAARCSPETVKLAMLASGTQGEFVKYQANDSTGMMVDWSMAAMWLRSAKAGVYLQFE